MVKKTEKTFVEAQMSAHKRKYLYSHRDSWTNILLRTRVPVRMYELYANGQGHSSDPTLTYEWDIVETQIINIREMFFF